MQIKSLLLLLLISVSLTGCMSSFESQSVMQQSRAVVHNENTGVGETTEYSLDTVDIITVDTLLVPLYLHSNKAIRLNVPHCQLKQLSIAKKSSTVVLDQNSKYHYIDILRAKSVKDVKKKLDFYDIKISKQGSRRWYFSSEYENVVGIIQKLNKGTFLVYYSNKTSLDEDVDEEFYMTLSPVLLKRKDWELQTVKMDVGMSCGVTFDTSVFDIESLNEDTCVLHYDDAEVTITLYNSDSVFADRDGSYDQLRRCCTNIEKVDGELRGTNEYNAYRCIIDDEAQIGFLLRASSTEEMSTTKQAELLGKLCEIQLFREEVIVDE